MPATADFLRSFPPMRISARLAAVACIMVCAAGVTVQAQSSNPADLRRIIDQKNSEAAAATWGYYVPTAATPGVGTGGATGPNAGGGSSGFAGSGDGSGSASAAGSGGPFGSVAPSVPTSVPTSDPATRPADPVTLSTTDPASSPETTQPASPAADKPATDRPDADTPAADPAPAANAPAPTTKAQVAIITFTAGQLKVQANDSSLDQVLKEVCRVTGMTLSGSVRDERVFGTIGPGKPAQVIAQLLDGVKTNFVLRQDAHTKASELVLTPVVKR